MSKVDISVVIVSFNTKEILRQCLEIVQEEIQSLNCEIIIVDNASKDRSADMVSQQFPKIHLIRSQINLGFAGANNVGLRKAKGDYVVLLNSDAFLHSGALKMAWQKMEDHPEVGLAGGMLVGEDGSWQPSARQFPSLLNDFLQLSGLAAKYPHSHFFGRGDRTWAPYDKSAEIDWVPGAFSIARRSILEQLEYFDERFFLYYEEVDLCKRIKNLGYQIWYWSDVIITHLGGESAKTIDNLYFSSSESQLILWRMRSTLLYYRKCHGFCGAYCRMLLERGWHLLRIFKNYWFSDREHQAKVKESLILNKLMRQAWRDTHGGKVSPSRPW